MASCCSDLRRRGACSRRRRIFARPASLLEPAGCGHATQRSCPNCVPATSTASFCSPRHSPAPPRIERVGSLTLARLCLFSLSPSDGSTALAIVSLSNSHVHSPSGHSHTPLSLTLNCANPVLASRRPSFKRRSSLRLPKVGWVVCDGMRQPRARAGGLGWRGEKMVSGSQKKACSEARSRQRDWETRVKVELTPSPVPSAHLSGVGSGSRKRGSRERRLRM